MEPKLHTLIVKTTKSGNGWHKQLTFYDGNLTDINMSKDNRFKAIYREYFQCNNILISKQSFLLGVAAISFPVQYPLRLHNGLVVLQNTDPFLTKVSYRGYKKNDMLTKPTLPDLIVDMGKVVPNKRQTIYDRDGNKCLKCGRKDNLTLDHILPKAHGGDNAENNLQTLCRDCNQEKAANAIDYRSGKAVWLRAASKDNNHNAKNIEEHWVY